MKQLLAWLTLIVSVLILPAAQAQDTPILSDDAPYPCPNLSGAYYQAGVFPRFEIQTRNLVLVDNNGATIRTLDQIEQNVRIINWSPDCRYLTGAVGDIRTYSLGETRASGEDGVSWRGHQIRIWDTVGSTPIASIPNPGRHLAYDPVRWNLDGDQVLILGGCEPVAWRCSQERVSVDFIWNSVSNTLLRLGGAPIDAGYWVQSRGRMNQIYWDLERQWIWGSARGQVIAYDINTGLEAAVFSVCPNDTPPRCWSEARFRFSDDGSKLIVYSIDQPGMNWGSITIHDLTTREAITVNTEGFAAPHIPYSTTHPIALSVDNRYLIAGFDAIRVWDIQNLPAAFDERLPIYRHAGPDATIDNLRFADWGIIETTSAEGVQRWDLHTGAYIE